MDKTQAETPITLEDLKKDAEHRISIIKQEFENGFNFLVNHPKSVTFFGSARFDESNAYYKKARDLSEMISEKLRYSVISGGGPGIMEAANRGAFEAGGHSLGLTIKLPYEQLSNKYMTEELKFYYFFIRKVCLSFSAEAYIFFPGGFGTLDELFEILTLVQTGKIEKVPIILIGKEFWQPLLEFIKKVIYEENKAIDEKDMELYQLTENFEEIIEIIKKYPFKNGIKFNMDNI